MVQSIKAITRQNLYYRLNKYREADLNGSVVGKSISVVDENTAAVSDLSDPSSNVITEANAEANEVTKSIPRGDQKKGSTQAAKTAMSKRK